MVPPGGMSTSSAALRTASASKPPYFSLATGSTLLSRTQVWLKPIEQVGGAGLGLVAIDHDLGQVAEPGRERGGIEQLRRHRIDVAEIVDVLAEGLPQLVELAVAGAVAGQEAGAQAALARLPQEQRDVG